MRGRRVRLAMSFPSSKRYYTIVRRQIPVLDSSRTVQIPKNVVPPLPEKHGSSQGGGDSTVPLMPGRERARHDPRREGASRQDTTQGGREQAGKTQPKEGGSEQARHNPRRGGASKTRPKEGGRKGGRH